MNTRFAFAGFNDDVRDFRGASWGMSKEEVKFSEDLAPLNEGEGYIAYGDRVEGLDTVVAFHFMDDSLTEAGYAFRERLVGEHAYIREYIKLKDMLMAAYGEPMLDENTCGDCGGFCAGCCAEDDRKACSLVYLCQWVTPRSVIRLVLMGEDKGYDFGLLHMSRELEMRVGMR